MPSLHELPAPSLREIQAAFADALIRADTHHTALNILADGISPLTRLGFYRTNVFENYRKALSATYPAVEKLVGASFFARLAEEYSRGYVSTSGDVGQHGSRFAEFLARHESARTLPYLTDVARLEWSIEETFNGADHVPFDLARLAAVAAERCADLRFLLAPTCRLLRSDFPVDRIWTLCQTDREGEPALDLGDGSAALLIRRERFEVLVEAQTSGAFAMLSALSEGASFGDAFAAAIALDESFDPGAFLQRHVQSGVLVDFTLPATT